MNEEELARRMAGVLSASTRDIDERVTARLQAAREAALDARRMPSRAREGARSMLGRRAVLAAATVAALLMAVGGYWLMAGGDPDVEALDAALLTDDLPIDAYLDQDFKAWLEDG